MVIAPATALAQDVEPTGPVVATSPLPSPEELPFGQSDEAPIASQLIDFSADQVVYDGDTDVVTATGQVRMSSDGNYLAADNVTWDRSTGQVRAIGNVVVLTPEGDRLIGDNVELTDSLRDGTVGNLLVVLETGGRIAAERGTRSGDQFILDNAIYSPCPVTSESGCARKPSWSITAARVIHEPGRNRVRFQGGRLQLFGVALPLLPVFAIGTGGQSGGVSGWLAPDLSYSSRNGLEIALPRHWRFAPNRDLTVTPHIYTGALPAIEARYRHLNQIGAFQIGGFATYGRIEDPDPEARFADNGSRRGLRAYFEANGKAQLDPLWSVTSSLRFATDKTVTRRYDITRDDRLRNLVNVERITPDSYLSIAGWAFQGLRGSDDQDEIPIALPALDARLRVDPPMIGGIVELQANSLAIIRFDGQDTQRAFASARWNLRTLTPLGQELLLTAFARGDAYHTDESAKTSVAIYRGEDGWNFRGIGALAADLKWPLIGGLFGGTQRLVPRLQLVLTPPTPNLEIPNEDARAVDLEDSNLFALNRFPGYDRWEDGSRVTYGVDWAYDRPNLAVATTVGQSYRISRDPVIFPEGTGLTDRYSDYVGRTRVRYGRLVELTHRFRVDKDSFEVRRNEVDLTVGSDETYALIGYLRLNRNIDPTIEDLRDKEELRLAGRVKFARYWSIFGATVIDLTDEEEDPLSIADGYEPVRHRLGINYEDECIDIGLTWRRDYERFGEYREGSTFALRFALKGLGR
ncbi:MAG: LPS assembly protein LptD [Pseudomonadota bacterium]|nr:LPS assembly protein LptD [Pseudomonadota bacterium]